MDCKVPEISLTGATDSATRRAIVESMAAAWRTWGVFLVVNHGVPQEVVDGAREQALRLFALPMTTKHQAMRASGEFAGYGNGAGTTVSQSDDYGNESVRVMYPGNDTRDLAHKLWSEDAESFSDRYETLIEELQKLTSELVELLGEGLPEEADRLHIRSYFSDPCVGALRLNYYPVSTTLGLPAHADIAALALLHQCDGGGGLQVWKDGAWVTVQARSDAFVVIMGTVYQIMTNGECGACVHRAVQGGDTERLSVVFSLWPDPVVPMVPAPSFCKERSLMRYKGVTFPEFCEAREADLLDPLNCIAAVDAGAS